MKHIKTYQLFESDSPSEFLTEEQIEFLNQGTTDSPLFRLGTMGPSSGTGSLFTSSGGSAGYPPSSKISAWTYNPETKLVDIKGNFQCSYQDLSNFKDLSFGKVTGYFTCSGNQLVSLKGAPREVGLELHCAFNRKMTTLEGSPVKIGDDFQSKYCELINLVGGPTVVLGNYDVMGNNLTSLEGAPVVLEGSFISEEIYLDKGDWNFEGWTRTLNQIHRKGRKLLETLPQLDPNWWLKLHREDRKMFNQVWLGLSQNPQIIKNPLFQKINAEIEGKSGDNLRSLQDLKDFGL
jgi:hypothetical protein